jgi:WD40 repeat protein
MNSQGCPSTQELDRLIEGRLPNQRVAEVTEHLGQCPACQDRLEKLAADNDAELVACVRQCGCDRPPPGSAIWPALSAAEAELSATLLFPSANGDTRPSGEIKLSFLRASDVPGRIGQLGRFEIVREVGRGGMGVVLHAYDPQLQRDVAVKVLDPQLAGNEVARQRFCREARAAAAVTHENLVAVHQVDEDEASGLPYLVMQLIQGESLEQRLRRVAKLSPEEVMRLGQQAAAGLAAAHATGLIHRDIKPGNILLESGTDRVKLTDFGLARAAEDVKLTRTGIVAGTPLYMAPEQARGEDIDARADLFSLGSVLYEAANGSPPFDAKTPLAVLRRVADETQPSLRDVESKFPIWLSDVIDRLLEKNPTDRFQSAAEVADIFTTELARSQTSSGLAQPVGPCGEPTSSVYALRPRRPICWKAVALRVLPCIAGVLLGGLVVGFWPPRSASNPGTAPTAAAALPVAVDPGLAPKATIPGKSGPIWALDFTPDGETMVVGAEDGSIRLFSMKDQKFFRSLPRMGGTVWGLRVSGDGQSIVAATDEFVARVYDFKSGVSDREFGPGAPVKVAIFTPDSKQIITGDRLARAMVWDREDQIPVTLSEHRGTIHGLAVSPDGKQLATAGSDGLVKLWRLDNLGDHPKSERTLEFHEGPVYGVAFSPDREHPRLASVGWDGVVRIWDPRNGDQLHALKGHEGDIWDVSFGQGGKILASAGSDGTVRIWDVATGSERQVLRGTGRSFHAVEFAPDGTTLAAGSRDGAVRLWDIK